MIKWIKGKSVFESNAQVLVNSVNCCGVMGIGIAKEFKKRYPIMYKDYREACNEERIDIGKPQLWKSRGKQILNFPTKKHFIQPSKLEYIEIGLQWVRDNYKKEGIKSIAFPQLGCSHGKLRWEDVKPLFIKYLGDIEDLPVEVYIYTPTYFETIDITSQ